MITKHQNISASWMKCLASIKVIYLKSLNRLMALADQKVFSRTVVEGLVAEALDIKLAKSAMPTLLTKAKLPLVALLILPFSAFAATGVDWVVYVNDTGYDPMAAGGDIVYEVKVSNNGFGPSSAPLTTLNLTIDPNTTFVSATGMACSGTGPVTCTVPVLAPAIASPSAPGGSATVFIKVKTSHSGNVALGASVLITGDDDATNNNPPPESTTVNDGSDIALSLTGPSTAQSGSSVSYTYTAVNNGPNIANSFVLSVPVTSGLANIAPPSGCVLSGPNYDCTITGPVAVGASVIKVFSGQISAVSGSTITPQGLVGSGNPVDGIASNNNATLNTVVTAGSDLTILKSRSPAGPHLVGDAVNFTLTPAYTGDSPSSLTITDIIPSNYIVGAIASPQNGWACSKSGQTVTCTKPAGSGAGNNVGLGTIIIPAITATAGSNIVNTANVSATGPSDPNPSNNSGSDAPATINAATVDLTANKSGPGLHLAVQGQTYDYAIDMSNIGNATFIGDAVMVDHLPAGLTVNTATTNGWLCLPAMPVVGPQDITCTIVGATVASGATTPTVYFHTTVTGTGSIQNSLTVSTLNANIAETNFANNSTGYVVTGGAAGASADVRVTKAASGTVVVGDVLTYTLEIINDGPSTSNSVALSDTIVALIDSNEGPTGAGFVSATIANGTSTGGACTNAASSTANARDLSCNFTTIPLCVAGSGNCPVITVSVRPGGNAGVRTNTVYINSYGTPDPNLNNNNSGSISSNVTALADVTVTKTAAANIPAGQNLTYVVTAQNLANGMSSADNVTIDDTLPDNVTFISATPSSGTCATKPIANSTTLSSHVICNLLTIGNGGQQTVTIVVSPNTATNGTTVNNVVDVTTSTPEVSTANNHANAPTLVTVPVFDLLINKTQSTSTVAAGDSVVYTVAVTNQGPSAAQAIVMTDTLPVDKLSYQSNTSPAGGSCSAAPAVGSFGGTVTCNVPYIASGATSTFTVTMLGVAKGSSHNIADVSSVDESTLNLTNNHADILTSVRTKADMQVVSKMASANPVNLNQPFNYVVKIRNNTGPGLVEADDVVVSDNLPAGMVLTGIPTVGAPISGTITISTCTGVAGSTTFSCSLGTVSSGGEVEITVPVKVTTVSGVFTNTASVLTSSYDTNGGNVSTAGNNFNSGTVTINKSSLAGIVYRDLNDDGTQFGAGETGIASVQMKLTGTDLYGNAVTAFATTDVNGIYLFDNLPPSSTGIGNGYTVIEVAQPVGFNDGKELQGTANGSPGADHTTDVISNIVLPATTAATGYLFGELPFINVSGNVYNDPNGLTDSSITAGNTAMNASSATLTAYLVSHTGAIVASSLVNGAGAFNFAGVAPDTAYKVVLSNTAGLSGSNPAPSLPAGWVNTGEFNSIGVGSDLTVDGTSTTFAITATDLVDIVNRNFGIEQPPVVGTSTYLSQPNPTGTNSVAVGEGAFTGLLPVGVLGTNATDATAVTNIKFPTFPTNVTSITINGINYTSFPPSGITITVAQLAGMVIDPVDGLVTVSIPYIAIDAAGKESAIGAVNLPFGGVTVSGNVYKDANGLLGTPLNTIDGTPTNAGSANLTAYLVTGGTIVASNTVAAGGTFSFANVAAGSGYTIVLSNTPSLTGASSAIPAGSTVGGLPAGWVNTGENNAASTVAGSDGTVDGKSAPFVVGATSVIDRNFGIEQVPDTSNVSSPSQANPLGATQVQVPTLIGNDTEDGVKGAGSTFQIVTLPNAATMGVLYYNGVPVTAGQIITNYDPTKLTVDPVDGLVTITFTVASIDAAGKVDPTPATVTMPFGQLVLSGNVFDDVNGNKIQGAGEDAATKPIPAGLNAVLTNAAGVVIAVAPINPATGTYSFNVAPNSTYSITVTKATPVLGATVVPVILPAGWVTTGENLNGVVESTPNSKQTITTGTTDVVNVNFGLAPTASLSGIVWRDNNHDRAFTAGEPLVPGITVEVLNAAKVVVGTATTDVNGAYSVSGLTPGVPYQVQFRDSATGSIILGTPTYDQTVLNTAPGSSLSNVANGTSTINAGATALDVTLIAGKNLANQSLPLDPSGVVYDAIKRTPVQGATVTLLNALGVPVLSTCLIGGQNSQVTGPLGLYQYLLINNPVPAGCQGTGVYTLQVVQPSGYLPPNSAIIPPTAGPHAPSGIPGSVEAVQAQPVPPTGAQPTIYFMALNLTVTPLGIGIVNNHIPLDPVTANSFFVSKTGNKSIAEIGDTVLYTIQARLINGMSVVTSQLVDNLPAGFKYIPGTANIAKGGSVAIALADPLPAGNLGPQLTFQMGAFNSVTPVTVTYKVRVGVGAMQGDGINRVQGRSGSIVSNTAQFKVKVTGGVFTNDACVAGKVFVDCNGNHIQDPEETGIPGVRMYMEDGTYFISDIEGKYSYCGISPRTHVLKVDALTLPRGSRLTTTSNRNAGDANSLFLDVKNGELIRADFAEGSCSNTVMEQVKARRAQGEVRAPETEKKHGPALKFEGKSVNYPQQGTDSANQVLVKPRGSSPQNIGAEAPYSVRKPRDGGGDAAISETEHAPVNDLPDASGNTRGNNLRDKGVAK